MARLALVRSAPARAFPGEEDPPDMADADAAVQASVRRLVDLIQVIVPTLRPAAVRAIETCVSALVVDATRQRITDRIAGFSAEDLATVDLLTASLAQPPGEEPDAPA
ncbi:MAG TPA: hypothetical protein VKR23_16105 [Gaiellaceae bacterium]|nr:hypothetical protein [Gaiellaceae bacterium]